MKKYEIKATYKGSYYRGPIDTREKTQKTITASFDTIDKLCEWLTKNPTYDTGCAYLYLDSYKVFKVETIEIDNNNLLSMKETRSLPCYIHHAYTENLECVNHKCPFFELCDKSPSRIKQ
jgi:hypothetical protein